MREILFRGKRKDNGEWIYGFYMNKYVKDIIVDTTHGSLGFGLEVDGETVGQYTGLVDKNGTKIFEGDIVKFDYYFDNPQLVKWNNDWCAFEPIFDARPIEAYPLLCETNIVEVIGDIYDNKNLLEEQL